MRIEPILGRDGEWRLIDRYGASWTMTATGAVDYPVVIRKEDANYDAAKSDSLVEGAALSDAPRGNAGANEGKR